MQQTNSPAGEDLRRRFLQEEAWIRLVGRSNCLDRQLGAIVAKNDRIIGEGWNLCAPPPHNYGDKLPLCPRFNAKRGTNRRKCRGFHAEIFAFLSATEGGITPKDYARFAWHQFDGEMKGARTRRVFQRRFTTADRERLKGAVLYLVGVAYVCDACKWSADWLEVIIPDVNVVSRRMPPDELTRLIESAKP